MRLTVRNLHKAYSTPVLRGVDLQIGSGEIHGIVGENGAGKSTLLNILGGNTLADCGELEVDGLPYAPMGAQSARRAGLSMCAQELSLIDNLDVAENIGLSDLPGKLWVNRKVLCQRADELLSQFNLDLPPDEPVRNLSLANRQLVELAKALNSDCRLLLLDEPTSALNAQQTDLLHACLRRRAERSVSVLYVSHRLEDVLSLCDYVWVMRDGEVVQHAPAGQLSPTQLIESMSGAALVDHLPDAERAVGPIHLSVQKLCTHMLQHPASFDCHRGEILGLAGLMGAGRTELLEAVFGLVPRTSGSVKLITESASTELQGVDHAITSGVGLLAEDRASQGIFAGQSVAFNSTIAGLNKIASHQVLMGRAESLAVDTLVERLNVKCDGREQAIDSLSGGNQQKLMLARWLHRECSLLLLDEPTRGVDVAAKQTIHSLLRSLRDQGVAVVVASSETEELIALCDRIAVMSAGRLVATYERGTFDQDKILQAAFSAHSSSQNALPNEGQVA